MANIYWVGGSGTWNTTSVTNWADAPGGTGGTGTVPTTNDNVFFDQAGTYTVTMTGALNCSDITVSAGTVTFATGTSPTLGISGSVSIIAGTVWNSTGTITFNATTAKTISTNGITIDAPVTFNGVAGSWQLQSAFTTGSTRTVTLTNGTIDLNNFTLTCGLFSSSGSTARTLAFGTSGQLALTGNNGTILTLTTATNLTTTGTVYINCLYTGATGTRTFSSGLTEAQAAGFSVATSGTSGIVLSPSATDTIALTGSFYTIDLTGFTGTLSNTARTIYGNLVFPSSGGTYSGGSSVTTFAATSGTKTITTNGRTLDFILTFNGIGGTWQLQGALTIGTTRSITLSNGSLDLNNYTITTGLFLSSAATARTIAFGTGNITLNVNATNSIDISNATNLTLTGTPIFQLTNAATNGAYLGTTAGYFTEANALSVYVGASTGAAGLYIPTTTGSLVLSGNFKDINLTGFTGTIVNVARTIYGNLTIPASGVTLTAGTSITTFAATSGTKTITTNAVALDLPITFNGVGGTWQLQNALTIGTTRTTTLTSGSLDLNGYTLTTGLFSSTNSNTRTIAFGTGNITVNGNSLTSLDIGNATALTITGTPIFQVTNSTSSGIYLGTTPGYFTEANSLSLFVGASTGAAGVYVSNTTTLALNGNFNNVNFTGFTGSINNAVRTIYGNLTIPASGTTFVAGASATTFASTSGTKTIVTNGTTLDFPATFNGAGGTWQLSSALTFGSTRTVTLTSGTLDLNNYTLTTGLFASSGSTARTIVFGTGNITVNGTGTVWNTATVTLMTTTGTPVVNVANNTATAATVTPGNLSEANAISFNFTTGTYSLTFLNTASNTAKNVDFTGFAGTWGTTPSTSLIYGNLKISSGMTLTASASAFKFAGTSGTKTITSNGKTLDFPLTFDGVGSTWQLQDALTVGSTRATTLTNGTIDLNNLVFSTGLFSSSTTAARTIAFGTSGQLALSGSSATILDVTTATNLTTSGAVYINCTYTGSAGTRTLVTGASESQSVYFPVSTSGTSGIVLSPSATDTIALTSNFGTVDLTGFTGTLSNTARKIYGNFILPSSGGAFTAGTSITTFGGTSGTSSINTNGRTLDFPVTIGTTGTENSASKTWQLQGASIIGQTRTFTLTAGTLDLNGYTLTTGLFSSTNTNTRTIAFGTGNITVNGTGSGTTTWDTGTSTSLTTTGTRVVNISNSSANSITVTTGTLSESDAISFNFTTGTYTLNLFKAGVTNSARNIDFTGFAGTLASNTDGILYGNMVISSGMTIASSGQISYEATSGTQLLTTNGTNINYRVKINCPGATVQAQGSVTFAGAFDFYAGTFDANGYSISNIGGNFTCYPSTQKYLNLTGSTLFVSSYFILDASLSIIGSTTISTIGPNVSRIYGNGVDLSAVTLNLGYLNGFINVYSDNHFHDITNTVSPTKINFNNGTTTTVDNFSLLGSPGNLVTIDVVFLNSPTATISKSSGIVACDYLSITKSVATGGATFYAGSHSVNGGGNSGWIFSDPPVPTVSTGNMFLVM